MFLSLVCLFFRKSSEENHFKKGRSSKFLLKSAHKTDQLIAFSIYVYLCECVFVVCAKLIFYSKLGRKFCSCFLIPLFIIEKRSMDGIEKFCFPVGIEWLRTDRQWWCVNVCVCFWNTRSFAVDAYVLIIKGVVNERSRFNGCYGNTANAVKIDIARLTLTLTVRPARFSLLLDVPLQFLHVCECVWLFP